MAHFDSYIVQVEIFNLNDEKQACIFVNGVPARKSKGGGGYMGKMVEDGEQKALAELAGEGYTVDDLRFSYFDVTDELVASKTAVEDANGNYAVCKQFKVQASSAMRSLNRDAFAVVAPNW